MSSKQQPASGIASDDAANAADSTSDAVSLWDWRTQVQRLYAEVRASRDPRTAWENWRHTRDALFGAHPQSPLPPDRRAGFAGLPYFPYDPALRFTVPLGPAATAPIELEIGRDGRVRLKPFARTIGLAPAFGRELTLYWIEGYGGGVFLPFRDAPGGTDTYAGGRYLLDTIKGADLGRSAEGHVVLDFNFSYNPSCSYDERWTCPLPPAENTLAVVVRAGERVR